MSITVSDVLAVAPIIGLIALAILAAYLLARVDNANARARRSRW